MKTAKKVLSIAASVLLWAIILVAALFAFTTLATRDENNVGNLAGFTPLTVESNSMSPTFVQGDMIIIKKVDPSTLQEGDIITFHTIIENQYALNTHRIVHIEDTNGYRSYTTQGDNNLISDSHVIANGDIVGKYVGRLAGFGKVINFLSSSLGFLLVIILPLLCFFVYQVYHLITIVISLKKATALEAAQEAAKVVSESAEKEKSEKEALEEEIRRLRAEAEALKNKKENED